MVICMDYKVLADCQIFHGLSEKEISELLNRLSYKMNTYDKGEAVFHLMDDADHLAIILRGRVQVQKIFPGGGHMQVNIGGPGDMIGEAAVFSERHKYPCELTALEDAELLLIERDEMLKLLQSNQVLLNNFITELSTATYQLQWRIELLSYTGIQQKIAFYLLSHSMQSGQDTVPLPDSITKWALSMNVSRPSLHRELKDMENRGYITVSAPFVTILNKDALMTVME